MSSSVTPTCHTGEGSLPRALAQARRQARTKALLFVVPLLLFLGFTFVVPVGLVLKRSFYDDAFTKSSPHLETWFSAHGPQIAPDEAAFVALAADLRLMKSNRTAGEAGTRINYVVPGSRSLFTSAARHIDSLSPPYAKSLPDQDARWRDPLVWHAMRSASHPHTLDFYLAALDRQRDQAGHIVPVPSERRIYLPLFGKTFFFSGFITCLCLALAYPLAHLLASLPPARSNLLMIFVLLPFWTSLLVRTSSWIVLLQDQGVINNVLVSLGLIRDDARLSMIYNRTGTVVVMTHILLPFMVLPLYSVMRMIDPRYVRAARSLGATSWTAFRRVYLPQTLPGIGAGALLVFILSVGYYITPALVGGADGQLISNMIQFHMGNSDWSLAAALAVMLLTAVMALYWIYDKLVGIDKLKLG